MTATTAMPDAVRTGFAFNFGTRIVLYSSGTAAIISTRRGWVLSLYFDANIGYLQVTNIGKIQKSLSIYKKKLFRILSIFRVLLRSYK